MIRAGSSIEKVISKYPVQSVIAGAAIKAVYAAGSEQRVITSLTIPEISAITDT
jgi:hypothetical protein